MGIVLAASLALTTIAPAALAQEPQPPQAPDAQPQPAAPEVPPGDVGPQAPPPIQKGTAPPLVAGLPARPVPALRPHGSTRARQDPRPHAPASRPAAAPAAPAPAPLSTSITDATLAAFSIPPFLLPIYQAAASAYQVPWQVLAAINSIESDYGRNLAVSSAGAVGWMQFMPATWRTYGVDANLDGQRDPLNPADAIFAAARYLDAAGAARDLRRAIFSYNHADWYVSDVLRRATAIEAIPGTIVDSLTGLAQARFPISGPVRWSPTSSARRSAALRGNAGRRVVAVADGRVVALRSDPGQGRLVVIEDAFGNRFTYRHLSRRNRAHVPAPHAVRPGERVRAGAVLGYVGGRRPVEFGVRPAGAHARPVDPTPLLRGWRELERAALFGPSGTSALASSGDRRLGPGQALLLSKDALSRRVLGDRRVHVYACGRQDVATGQIDRRVLATLEFLADGGLEPTVTALRCGHSVHTASGNVSEHSTGSAVDIAALNGVPIAGHQGPGSVTDVAVRRLLALQGAMKPHQIITLMAYAGTDNTLALADHADHIHVGFRPSVVTGGASAPAALAPGQWQRLMAHLTHVRNPSITRTLSRFALPATDRRFR